MASERNGMTSGTCGHYHRLDFGPLLGAPSRCCCEFPDLPTAGMQHLRCDLRRGTSSPSTLRDVSTRIGRHDHTQMGRGCASRVTSPGSSPHVPEFQPIPFVSTRVPRLHAVINSSQSLIHTPFAHDVFVEKCESYIHHTSFLGEPNTPFGRFPW
jgi:hypothetical protein